MIFHLFRRLLSSTRSLGQKDKSDAIPEGTSNTTDKTGGWLNKILGGQKVETTKVSHSTMLTDKEITYEMSSKLNRHRKTDVHFEPFSS